MATITKKVTIVQNVHANGKPYKIGQTATVSEKDANLLIGMKKAVDPAKMEKADIDALVELNTRRFTPANSEPAKQAATK